MVNFSKVPTRDLVLLALLKLSGGGSGLCVENTIKNILKELKDWGRVVTRTRVEQILDDLESHFIYGQKGLLNDGRVRIYGIKSLKVGHETFTIIKDSEKAVVCGDTYRGIIYSNDYAGPIRNVGGFDIWGALASTFRKWAMGAEMVVAELSRLESTN